MLDGCGWRVYTIWEWACIPPFCASLSLGLCDVSPFAVVFSTILTGVEHRAGHRATLVGRIVGREYHVHIRITG